MGILANGCSFQVFFKMSDVKSFGRTSFIKAEEHRV